MNTLTVGNTPTSPINDEWCSFPVKSLLHWSNGLYFYIIEVNSWTYSQHATILSNNNGIQNVQIFVLVNYSNIWDKLEVAHLQWKLTCIQDRNHCYVHNQTWLRHITKDVAWVVCFQYVVGRHDNCCQLDVARPSNIASIWVDFILTYYHLPLWMRWSV